MALVKYFKKQKGIVFYEQPNYAVWFFTPASKICKRAIKDAKLPNHSQITIKLLDEGCETEFCKKVREFLSHIDNNKIVNPISALADKNYMESLTALERQRYIFDIAEKYNRIKEEYYSEQIMLNG